VAATVRLLPARDRFNTNLRTWRLLGGRADVAIQNGYLVMRAPLGPLKAGMRLRAVDQHDPLLFKGYLSGLDIWVLFRRNRSGVVESLSVRSTAIFLTLYKRL